jgi:GNAT superfamily N-acetyltransferase
LPQADTEQRLEYMARAGASALTNLAEADGSVVGVAALAQGDASETLDLAKLFVMPGRLRSGIGRALFAHAVTVARHRGARRLTILADPNETGRQTPLKQPRLLTCQADIRRVTDASSVNLPRRRARSGLR